MDLSNKTLSLLVLLSLGASVGAIVYTVMIAPGSRRSDDDAPIALTPELQALLDAQTHHTQRIEAALRRLAAESRRQATGLRGAVQHVGMVRYDAFEDVGGRLSFSCALLDGRGDGVVITSINGRQDTRVYAKPVNGGQSTHNLSEEEVTAIQQAVSGGKEAVNAG